MGRHPLIAVLWLGLAGCPKSAGVDAEAAFREALEAADRAWALRGQLDWEEVAAPLDGVVLDRQDHPEVGWRRARIELGRALSASDPSSLRRGLARARGVGMACITALPSMARAQREHKLPDVLATLPLDRVGCAAWAGYAWARWLRTYEPAAAALDHAQVAALLKRGAYDATGERRDVVRWGRALLALTDPEAAGRVSVDEARAALSTRARGTGPGHWVAWEDLGRPAPVPTAAPTSPEDRGAQRRALAPNHERAP